MIITVGEELTSGLKVNLSEVAQSKICSKSSAFKRSLEAGFDSRVSEEVLSLNGLRRTQNYTTLIHGSFSFDIVIDALI